jgi:hypothetical protein
MTFDLPASNVFVVLRRAFRAGRPKAFSFPVDFSPDLQQILVLGIVLRMSAHNSASGSTAYKFHSQNLIDVTTKTDEPSDLEMLFFSQHVRSSGYIDKCIPGDDWYRTKFSPNGKFILAIRGNRPLSNYDSLYTEYQLTIHHDDRTIDEQPNFRYLTGQFTKARGNIEDNLIFHPVEPILAISRLGNAVLWFFAEQR